MEVEGQLVAIPYRQRVFARNSRLLCTLNEPTNTNFAVTLVFPGSLDNLTGTLQFSLNYWQIPDFEEFCISQAFLNRG